MAYSLCRDGLAIVCDDATSDAQVLPACGNDFGKPDAGTLDYCCLSVLVLALQMIEAVVCYIIVHGCQCYHILLALHDVSRELVRCGNLSVNLRAVDSFQHFSSAHIDNFIFHNFSFYCSTYCSLTLVEGWGFEPQLRQNLPHPCLLLVDALPLQGTRCSFRILLCKNNNFR